ncbi:hypothetical protein EJ03DRAFT_213258 [Teratosphaeria nubilosa]|uniref:Uncharacterized protein n=1 Tax=Teratosphaeria nubilosa TaxID=161662 RepID=A0A6G1LGY6_9PEZI|nr:hypothetical protein EJ03DRAFT_213258 [Teratosphaeria nubilosa]
MQYCQSRRSRDLAISLARSRGHKYLVLSLISFFFLSSTTTQELHQQQQQQQQLQHQRQNQHHHHHQHHHHDGSADPHDHQEELPPPPRLVQEGKGPSARRETGSSSEVHLECTCRPHRRHRKSFLIASTHLPHYHSPSFTTIHLPSSPLPFTCKDSPLLATPDMKLTISQLDTLLFLLDVGCLAVGVAVTTVFVQHHNLHVDFEL